MLLKEIFPLLIKALVRNFATLTQVFCFSQSFKKAWQRFADASTVMSTRLLQCTFTAVLERIWDFGMRKQKT